MKPISVPIAMESHAVAITELGKEVVKLRKEVEELKKEYGVLKEYVTNGWTV